MDTDAVDRMLAEYTQRKARAAHLRTELDCLEHLLEREKENSMTSEALRAQSYDPMPHGNLPGNPVERLVLRFDDKPMPAYLSDLEKDIEGIREELFECETAIRFVDGWLLCLNERERFVVDRHVIGAGTWREILDEYEARWGAFGKEGLRKMKKRAMNKIYEAAE